MKSSDIVIHGVSDDAGSSLYYEYEDSLKNLPDHLRLHYERAVAAVAARLDRPPDLRLL
jgi:hypothetical protein